jgi:hypothetical protein
VAPLNAMCIASAVVVDLAVARSSLANHRVLDVSRSAAAVVDLGISVDGVSMTLPFDGEPFSQHGDELVSRQLVVSATNSSVPGRP